MYDGPTVYYDTKIKEFKQYMNGRYMAFPNLMKKTFSLKDPCTIKITVSDPEYGDVLLNRTDIDFPICQTLNLQAITLRNMR